MGRFCVDIRFKQEKMRTSGLLSLDQMQIVVIKLG